MGRTKKRTSEFIEDEAGEEEIAKKKISKKKVEAFPSDDSGSEEEEVEEGEVVEIVEDEKKKVGGKKKTPGLSKLDQLTAAAIEESTTIGDGHCGAFRCPLCDSIAAKSTGEDGETSYWCPIKCLLPWKDNASKPAFYAEIAASVDGLYRQQDGGKPPVCSHGDTMRLIHLDKSKVKNEFLKNSFFLFVQKL